jgi:hypothetical protein
MTKNFKELHKTEVFPRVPSQLTRAKTFCLFDEWSHCHYVWISSLSDFPTAKTASTTTPTPTLMLHWATKMEPLPQPV